MNYKILVCCAVLCIINICCGELNGTVEMSPKDIANEKLDLVSIESSDLNKDASIWRLWRPFRNMGTAFKKKLMHSPFRKESEHTSHNYRNCKHRERPKIKNKIKFLFKRWWRRGLNYLSDAGDVDSNVDTTGNTYIARGKTMFYVDSQKTLVRRDSSLIRSKTDEGPDSASHFESAPLLSRPRGMVQRELVTFMFESMLGCIIESWEPVTPVKSGEEPDDTALHIELATAGSAATITSTKKKKTLTTKVSKPKRSRSKMGEEDSTAQANVKSTHEKVVIQFRNGNLYEGNINMKCMNGEGRFQWADGTVYLGQFRDNEIVGKGIIQWKDDTWYQGEFAGNLRHGQGLYVDSRLQRSYMGGWHCGTKHGQGVIYYSKDFKNSYDGHWIHNERFGYGSREYCISSGYEGEWERNIREGRGLMIWPNNDCYRGEWKNGVMSGNGIYLWDAYYNNSMSMPSLKAYRGGWEKGMRNGYGVLNFGSGWGSYYKGEFKNNNKHGPGLLVTNDGLILEDKQLFIDDNMGPCNSNTVNKSRQRATMEPYHYDICDSTVGLAHHIAIAVKNIDKSEEITSSIINEYILNNKPPVEAQSTAVYLKDKKINNLNAEEKNKEDPGTFQDFFTFEEISLSNAIKCYISDLKTIYYTYATICNTQEINFTPIMIRLYLWQLYFDCRIHDKGLNLYDIDEIFYQNREWLARSPHDPFEKIYFWQFLHSLISVASTLYAKRKMPGPRPDTIVANAFRTFMEQDLLPSCNRRNGHLVNGYGIYIPLKASYALYETLGEPPTIRNFIRAVRRSPHFLDRPQPPLIDAPDKTIPWGRNVFIFGDSMIFCIDSDGDIDEIHKPSDIATDGIKLFNLANVSTKTIIKKFAKIFPQVIKRGKIIDLEVKLTFFEFFEAFIECIEESIKIKDEETKWRQKFSVDESTMAPHSTPVEFTGK